MSADQIIAIGALATTFVAGVAALFKLKPEGDQILVSSAKAVVVIQQGVIDDLRREIGELRGQMNGQLEAATRARVAAEESRDECRREREMEAARNSELTGRVVALEAELGELRKSASTGPGG